MKTSDYIDVYPSVIQPSEMKLTFFKKDSSGKLNIIEKDVGCTISVNSKTKTNKTEYKESKYLGRKIINVYTKKEKLIGSYFKYNEKWFYVQSEHAVSLSNVNYHVKYQASELNEKIEEIPVLKETTTSIITEEDIADYIQNCLFLEDRKNIYCGYKQEVDAQEEQMNNKFNISIYFLNFKHIVAGYNYNYGTEKDEDGYRIVEKNTPGVCSFRISVFNWLNRIDEKNGVAEERYDCLQKAVELYSYFRNIENFQVISELENISTRDKQQGVTIIEYSFIIQVINSKVSIKTKTKLELLENVIFNEINIIK